MRSMDFRFQGSAGVKVKSLLWPLVIILLETLAGGSITLAQGVERTCSGEFTDMRVIGLTLGDCDLNNISDSDVCYVKRVCGEPWGPDPSENNNEVPKCA